MALHGKASGFARSICHTGLCVRVSAGALLSGVVLGMHPAVIMAQQTPQPATVARTERSEHARPNAVVLARMIPSFSLNGVSLDVAIDSLSRVANVLVQYSEPLVAQHRKTVSVRLVNTSVGIAFERILDGTDLRVVPDGRGNLTVIPSTASADSIPQVGEISGRVVDSATGRGISGATVKVAGTKVSIVAGDSGRFLLRSIPIGERLLTVKAFGFHPAEQPVLVATGSVAHVRITVSPAPNLLSGVVTTATGVQERRTIGNDVTVINADSVMRVAPVHSVTDLLDARVPGLTVTRTSGMPGAPSRLRLRGIGGLASGVNTSNDPIIVVDGARVYSRQSTARDRINFTTPNSTQSYAAPSAIDQIDPNSIETIEVFKGPSATSQWGSDAGNGVIVITTKRGHAGRTSVTANANFARTELPGVYSRPNYYVFGGGKGSYTGGGISALCNGGNVGTLDPCRTTGRDSIVPFQALNVPRLSPFTTGTRQEQSVTVSGGSNAFTYMLTGSATNEGSYLRMPSLYQEWYRTFDSAAPPGWMVHPAQYRTMAGSAQFGFSPVENLSLVFTTSLYNSDQSQSTGTQSFGDQSSLYIDTASANRNGVIANGYIQQYVGRVRNQTTTTTNALQGQWKRWAWLPVSGQASVNNQQRYSRVNTPYEIARKVTYEYGNYAVTRGTAPTVDGKVSTTLFPDRMVSTSVGVQVTQQSTNDWYAYQDTLQPGVESPTSFRGSSQSSWATNTAGWWVEPKLNWSSKFFLTPGFRLDGGSASKARGTQTGGILALFPKLNFSWLAIDQTEHPVAGFISLLQPRMAFGIAGVQPDPTQNQRLFVNTYLADGKGGQIRLNDAIHMNYIGNTQLHPERSGELEGGVGAQLWGNRVSIDGSMYYKLRRDAIVQVETAPSVYALPLYINLGRVRNTGHDLTIDAGVIETPTLRWNVKWSYSSVSNTLLAVNSKSATYGTNFRAGYPLDGIWERTVVGYVDPDGDGRLLAGDVTLSDSAIYLGHSEPKYEMPFGTYVSLWHGRLSFNSEFKYTSGGTQVGSAAAAALKDAYWVPGTPLGVQAAAIAAANCGVADAIVMGSSYCSQVGLIQTVSTLRWKTASVRYDVPRSVSMKLGVPSLGLSLQGSNLRLWSNYRGKDPDVNGLYAGENTYDGGQPPEPRTWILRVDLGN